MHETHWHGFNPEHAPDSPEHAPQAEASLENEGNTVKGSSSIDASTASDDTPNEYEIVGADDGGKKKRRFRLPDVTKAGSRRSSSALILRELSAKLPFSTEKRVGIAAVLSFVILVTVMVVNRGRHPQQPAAELAAKKTTGEKSKLKPPADRSNNLAEAPLVKTAAKPTRDTPPALAIPIPTKSPESDNSASQEVLASNPPPPSGAVETIPEPTGLELGGSGVKQGGAEGTIPPLPTPAVEAAKVETPIVKDSATSPPAPVGGKTEDLQPEVLAVPPTPVAIEQPAAAGALADATAPVVGKVEEPKAMPAPVETPTPTVANPPTLTQTPETAPSAPIPTPAETPATPAVITSAAAGAAIAAGALPSRGKGVILEEGPERAPRADTASPVKPSPSMIASNANPVDEAIEPVTHVVQKGENFWTISRLYYGSGRFYKALWAANKDQVAAPERLFVGTSIKVPPPESLDRSQIEPARSEASPASGTSKARRSKPSSTAGASRPREASDVVVMLPDGKSSREAEPKPVADPEKTPPFYVVKPHQTLRSIARDVLNDPHRESEIRALNLDQLAEDGLQVGQRLRLPDDARVRR